MVKIDKEMASIHDTIEANKFDAIIKQTKQSQQKDLKTYVNNSNKSPLELLGNHLKGLEAIS